MNYPTDADFEAARSGPRYNRMGFFKRLKELSARRSRLYYPQCEDWSVLEWAGAACGEAGEMANVAKKIRRDGPSTELHQQLADEIADTVIYLERIATLQGIDFEDAIREKFNRVSREKGFCEEL
jgi:NTP pyrophosphatase (non-canonical NTP hydrolase)